MKTKKLMAAVAVALALCVTIGGTLAWLTDTTDEVKNTFTVGKVDIELKENTGSSYELIPGTVIEKDPTVGVIAGSEACYLFVEITGVNTENVITYEIAEGWTALEGQTGVYYRMVSKDDAAAGVTYPVLKDNEVFVSTEVTETTPEATLSFTAYAVQTANVDSAAEAWEIVKPATL